MTRPGAKLTEERRLKTNASSAAWKLRNPERVREKQRRWHSLPENRERAREWRKASYHRNREKVRASQNEKRLANPEHALLTKAKERARLRGLEFSITTSDITIPELCPLLGIPLRAGVKTSCPNSPTLDRLDGSLGYVPGNVWVISYRANRIKNDASLEELRAIVAGLAVRLAR